MPGLNHHAAARGRVDLAQDHREVGEVLGPLRVHGGAIAERLSPARRW
jgi:hypothetical protein